MKKTSLAVLLFAALATPALANDVPVPSFNDAPELYRHTEPLNATAGAAVDRSIALYPARSAHGAVPVPSFNDAPELYRRTEPLNATASAAVDRSITRYPARFAHGAVPAPSFNDAPELYPHALHPQGDRGDQRHSSGAGH